MSARASTKKRIFSWVLAMSALSFVVWSVPLRDRCFDPASPTLKVAVSRLADGACILHVKSGDTPLSAAECSRLSCEPGLSSALSHAKLPWLAALLVFYLGGTMAWAMRWRMLLSLAGVKLPLFGVWRVTLEAQAGGVLLPGGIGGDALRIAAMVDKGAPTATVVASVLLDRVIGLVTMATLAGVLAVAFDPQGSGTVPYIMAMIPLGFFAGLAVLRVPKLQGLGIFQRGILARTIKPILAYLGDPGAPRAIALGLLVSVLVSAVQLFAIRGLIFALGVVPHVERWTYLGTAISMIVSAIPALPGAWGTADAAYVVFFGRAGLAPSTSLAVCLLYRLFWYVSGAIGAVLVLVGARRLSLRTRRA